MALAHGRAGMRAAPARMGALRAVLYFPCTACGAVAQPGEHLLCKQGVRGSNPLSSTMCYRNHNSAAQDDLCDASAADAVVLRRGNRVVDPSPYRAPRPPA